jgi:uncharacterized phosphosugar-binding protein
LYGPGAHSALAAQELFYRAGSLTHLSLILDIETSIANGALRSTVAERRPGHGRAVIDAAGLASGDVLIIVNAFGVNAAVIDAARAAHDRGVTVIGISSTIAAESLPHGHPARHPDGVSLRDVADIHIDSRIPPGDVVLDIPGVNERVGGVSTIVNAVILQTLAICTESDLAERGDVALWRSSYSVGGDEANAVTIARLQGRVTLL